MLVESIVGQRSLTINNCEMKMKMPPFKMSKKSLLLPAFPAADRLKSRLSSWRSNRFPTTAEAATGTLLPVPGEGEDLHSISIESHLCHDDILLNILGFLDLHDLLRARVCRRWKEMVKQIPAAVMDWTNEDFYEEVDLFITSTEDIAALRWLPDAVPKLGSLKFYFFDYDRVWKLGYAEMSPIVKFRHLTNLSLHDVHLCGEYMYLFESFPNLRSLCFYNVGKLKWDLSVLGNMPRLERMVYHDDDGNDNDKITGNLRSLHVLKDSLIELSLLQCTKIYGNLMDLACFTSLKSVYLDGCDTVVGDIRDIGQSDFISIETLTLPDSVWGGGFIPSIEEAHILMQTWYTIQQQRENFFTRIRFSLPIRYHEHHGIDENYAEDIPSFTEFVVAARRKGWRWTNGRHGGACETNWFDPEPENPHEECYGVYMEDLKRLEANVVRFKGLFEPPTIEEYLRRTGQPRSRHGSDDTWLSL